MKERKSHPTWISMQLSRPVCPHVVFGRSRLGWMLSSSNNFFGVVRKCFNIFSSTQRWKILKSKIPNSLHYLSNTRWSARIDAVKPFATNLPGSINALKEVKKLNLTAETRRDVDGSLKYMRKFGCVLIDSIWVKIRQSINDRNLSL